MRLEACWLALVICVCLGVAIAPAIWVRSQRRAEAACLTNCQQISQALLAYASEWDNMVPPYIDEADAVRRTWMDRAGVGGIRCPSQRPCVRTTYALNVWAIYYPSENKTDTLADLNVADQSRTVLFADGWSILTACVPPMHTNASVNVGWVDGHVTNERASAIGPELMDRE